MCGGARVVRKPAHHPTLPIRARPVAAEPGQRAVRASIWLVRRHRAGSLVSSGAVSTNEVPLAVGNGPPSGRASGRCLNCGHTVEHRHRTDRLKVVGAWDDQPTVPSPLPWAIPLPCGVYSRVTKRRLSGDRSGPGPATYESWGLQSPGFTGRVEAPPAARGIGSIASLLSIRRPHS
jgi:hypothetical protein